MAVHSAQQAARRQPPSRPHPSSFEADATSPQSGSEFELPLYPECRCRTSELATQCNVIATRLVRGGVTSEEPSPSCDALACQGL